MSRSPTRGSGQAHRLGAARTQILGELRDYTGICAGAVRSGFSPTVVVRLKPDLLGVFAVLAVQQFFYELDALEVEQLHVAVEAAIERHADLPRPREDIRVRDRRLVH